jgi:hypothetical protein
LWDSISSLNVIFYRVLSIKYQKLCSSYQNIWILSASFFSYCDLEALIWDFASQIFKNSKNTMSYIQNFNHYNVTYEINPKKVFPSTKPSTKDDPSRLYGRPLPQGKGGLPSSSTQIYPSSKEACMEQPDHLPVGTSFVDFP